MISVERISYSTSLGTAGLGALTLNEWAIVIGIALSFGTFLVNRHYKHREDKRAQERHIREMRDKQ